MLCKLPDIDIPAVTNILHAVAFREFKQHVERPASEGQDLAAYTCWMHAVEIRRSPFVTPITSESELFPPLVKMPCCKRDCQRCAAHLGGFKFPWLTLAILGGCHQRVLHAPTPTHRIPVLHHWPSPQVDSKVRDYPELWQTASDR